MSRLVALLFLSVAGCTHDAPPAETGGTTEAPASNIDTTSSRDDASLQPASLEPRAPETSSPQARSPQAATPSPASAAPSTIKEPAATQPTTQRDTTTQPDNTKVNERDRSSAALTPVDQGNGESDLKLTQQIRQAVMADKALSFTAKNVKIISKDGKVTLRGPVKTAEERAAIEAHARSAAGAVSVDNQIEVKK